MVDFRYLLDTNILSDLLRNPGGRAARRLAVVGEATVCTSIVVACELRYGAAKKGSLALSERVEILLGSLEVLPLDKESDRHYAEIQNKCRISARVFLRPAPRLPGFRRVCPHLIALEL